MKKQPILDCPKPFKGHFKYFKKLLINAKKKMLKHALSRGRGFLKDMRKLPIFFISIIMSILKKNLLIE